MCTKFGIYNTTIDQDISQSLVFYFIVDTVYYRAIADFCVTLRNFEDLRYTTLQQKYFWPKSKDRSTIKIFMTHRMFTESRIWAFRLVFSLW